MLDFEPTEHDICLHDFPQSNNYNPPYSTVLHTFEQKKIAWHCAYVRLSQTADYTVFCDLWRQMIQCNRRRDDNNERCVSHAIEVRKCLLSFGAEPFVFQAAIQKFKDQVI